MRPGMQPRRVAPNSQGKSAPRVRLEENRHGPSIGALVVTQTILGVPYYNHSITGPKTLF